MARLRELAQNGEYPQEATLGPAGRKALMSKPWVVYAKTPQGGPAQVLEYLSRFTHMTVSSNERIKVVNPQEVSFTARANDQGGKRRITLFTPEFIRCFLLYVLPDGIERIRH